MKLDCAVPRATEKDVRKVLMRHYGLHSMKVTKWFGYFHQNFKILADTGREYVLKVYNTISVKHSQDFATSSALLQATYAQYGINTSTSVLTNNQEHYVEKKIGFFLDYNDGSRNIGIFHLLTFLEGIPLHDVAEMAQDNFDENCYEIGRTIAQMHRATKTFSPTQWYTNDTCPFYLHSTHLLMPDFNSITDQEHRVLVERCMQRITKNVYPEIDKMRKGYVHGDINCGNIILKSIHMMGQESKLIFSGVIDFDIIHYGSLAGDLATSISYIMLSAIRFNHDPLLAAKIVLKGYETIVKLDPVEKHLMCDMTTARMCQSLIAAYISTKARPDMKKNYFAQAKYFPSLLKLFKSIGEEEVFNHWFESLK